MSITSSWFGLVVTLPQVRHVVLLSSRRGTFLPGDDGAPAMKAGKQKRGGESVSRRPCTWRKWRTDESYGPGECDRPGRIRPYGLLCVCFCYEARAGPVC